MEPSSGASLCLEPLTAACKWQVEAGCLLKPHCIDKSDSSGCCLEASYSFSHVLVRLNFHEDVMVPEQLEALAQALLHVGL